jgi:hypothetical protein
MFTRLVQGKGKLEQGHTARRKLVSGTGDPSRNWNLKGWGWEGYVAYMNQAHSLSIYKDKTGKQCASVQYCQLSGPVSMLSTELNKSRSQKMYQRKLCHLVLDFKLGLANTKLDLPDGLTLLRVISDYLCKLSYTLSNSF